MVLRTDANDHFTSRKPHRLARFKRSVPWTGILPNLRLFPEYQNSQTDGPRLAAGHDIACITRRLPGLPGGYWTPFWLCV